jgi:hypothetical protein
MLKVWHITLLLGILFNGFALLKMQPENYRYSTSMSRGSYERSVHIPFRAAQERAQIEWSQIKDPFLFRGRNPGLFIAVSDLFVRLGAATPKANQIFCLLLFNLGFLFLFKWTLLLFKNNLLAHFVLWCTALSQYALMYSATIHMFSYQFLFFHMTLFFAIRSLAPAESIQKNSSQKYAFYLGACALSYFLLCMNYYMFYVSTWVCLIGLMHYYKKPIFSKSAALLTSIPIAALMTTFWQSSARMESSQGAFAHFKNFLLYRSAGVLHPDIQAHDRGSLTLFDFLKYPIDVAVNTYNYFHLPIPFLLLCLYWVYKQNVQHKLLDLRPLKFLSLAGVSWHLIMIQHSKTHANAVVHGSFFWVLIVALAMLFHWHSIRLKEPKYGLNSIVGKLCFFFVLFYLARGLIYSMGVNLFRYLS